MSDQQTDFAWHKIMESARTNEEEEYKKIIKEVAVPSKDELGYLKIFCRSLLITDKDKSYTWDIFDGKEGNSTKEKISEALLNKSIFSDKNLYVHDEGETKENESLNEFNDKLTDLLEGIYNHLKYYTHYRDAITASTILETVGIKVIFDISLAMQLFLNEVFNTLNNKKIKNEPVVAEVVGTIPLLGGGPASTDVELNSIIEEARKSAQDIRDGSPEDLLSAIKTKAEAEANKYEIPYANIEWDSDTMAPSLYESEKIMSSAKKTGIKLCDNQFKIELGEEGAKTFLIDTYHHFDLKVKIIYTVYSLLEKKANEGTDGVEATDLASKFSKREEYKDMPKTYIKKLIKALSEKAEIPTDVFLRLCMDFCFSYISTASDELFTVGGELLQDEKLPLPGAVHRLFNDLVFNYLNSEEAAVPQEHSYDTYLGIYYDKLNKTTTYVPYIDWKQEKVDATIGVPTTTPSVETSVIADMNVEKMVSNKVPFLNKYPYNLSMGYIENKINGGLMDSSVGEKISEDERALVGASDEPSAVINIVSIITKSSNNTDVVSAKLLYERQQILINFSILEPFNVNDARPLESKTQNIDNFNLLILSLYLSKNNIAEMYTELGLGEQYKNEDTLTDGIRHRNKLKLAYEEFNKSVNNNESPLQINEKIHELFSIIHPSAAPGAPGAPGAFPGFFPRRTRGKIKEIIN